MRFRDLAAVLVTLAIASAQTPATSGTIRLEDGTPVRLRLQRTLSSADAHVNDQIDFEVLDEIKVNGIVVIPKGGVAWGTVTAAQSKRRMARGGKLDVNIDSVRTVTGDRAALRAVRTGAGGGHVGAMAGGMVATAIFVPVAAPFFLLMHGKDVTIPKGTEITAYVNGDNNFAAAKLEPIHDSATRVSSEADTAVNQMPILAESRAVEDLATIVLNSDPDGGDISVDGKFLGNTPSTVRLPPGDHLFSVERLGFRTWQRVVAITPGATVALNAALEKN
jgi:hypothetical protein